MAYGRPSKERYAAEKAPATPTKDAPASAAKATPGSMFGRLTRGFGSASKLAGAKDPSVDPLTGKKLSKRAVARLRGVYIPPSVEEAMENRDEEHPRVQGPRGPEPYPLSIGTGDLGVEMGPGIALYFNFLQWMAVMFFVLFLLNFPTILVANAAKYYGPFSASRNSTGYQAVWDGAVAGDFDFASTTFGSIAPDDVEEGDWLIYNGFKSWGFVVHVTKVHFLYGCAAMDLLGVFLFFVVMFFFRRRQKAIVKSVDEDSIEISDYSVTVKGLPEDATDKEEVRCFFELKFGKVVDAVLAKNDGVLLTLYRKRGALSMKYDETHSKYIRKGAKSAQKLMEKIQGKIADIDKRIAKIKSKRNFKTKLAFVTFSDEESMLDCLEASPRTWLGRWMMPPEEKFRGTHAYTVEEAPAPTDVMFENLDVSPRSRFYRRLVIVLVTLALLVLSFAAITAISVLKVRLSMSTAMDPRALALDIGGEGGGAFGTTASRAAGGETPDAITLRDDFDGTTAFRPVCEPELALCESAYSDSGLLSVMRWGAPLDVVSVVSPMSESEKLVKVKSLMKEIAACARDPRGCSAARGEAAQKTRKCHACYCAGLQYARFPTSTETHRAGDLVVSAMTDKEVADLREQCDAFLTEPGSLERGLLFLAVAAVTIVNSGLKMIVQAVSAFERPDSFIELQKNIAEKVFAAQFFNTAVSSLVINAALPELVRGVPLLDGAVFNGVHRDFDQRWYESIGGPLMVTMFVNTVGPVGGNLAAELLGGVNRFLGRMTAWTQHALDASYLGPEFDIATRYGEVLMCVTVTMMYGSGMPLLYAFACFFCVTIAYFDKRHLLRVCRRPPRYGTSLAFLALAVVPWSGFVHLLFGMWMHTHFLTPSVASAAGGGYGDVFGEDPYDAAIAKNATRDAFATVLAQGASLEEILAIAKNASETAAASRRAGYAPIPDEINRRILQANGFPFFFAALLFLASFIALKILSTFWATFKSVLPCLSTLPCLVEDLTFEGVPTFEVALMTDKLVGAHTYEMRDMPKYKDFFFESKSPATTPKKKTKGGANGAFAENDLSRDDVSDSDTSDDSVSLGDISALLRSAGTGGVGSVAGSPLGGGFGAGAGGGLRAAYAANRDGENGVSLFSAPTEARDDGGVIGGRPTPLSVVNGPARAPAPAEMRRGRETWGKTTTGGDAPRGGIGRNTRA